MQTNVQYTKNIDVTCSRKTDYDQATKPYQQDTPPTFSTSRIEMKNQGNFIYY